MYGVRKMDSSKVVLEYALIQEFLDIKQSSKNCTEMA